MKSDIQIAQEAKMEPIIKIGEKLGLTEDDEKGWLEDSQKTTNEYIEKVEKLTEEKEKELMTI